MAAVRPLSPEYGDTAEKVSGPAFDPRGVAAISRGLSAAIPPDLRKTRIDPGGVTAHACCDPSGVETTRVIIPGGIAALNHRLMASTPPGSIASCKFLFSRFTGARGVT